MDESERETEAVNPILLLYRKGNGFREVIHFVQSSNTR